MASLRSSSDSSLPDSRVRSMGISIFVVFVLVNVCVLPVSAAREVVAVTLLAFVEYLAISAQAVLTRARNTHLCIHILLLNAPIQ
jgi:hypothetical protein